MAHDQDPDPIEGPPPKRIGALLGSSMSTLLRGLPPYAEDPEGFVAEFKRRGMAMQARGNRRFGGIFEPAPEPERVSAAARRQQRWTELVGALGDHAASWRLANYQGGWVDAVEAWLASKAQGRKAKRMLLAGNSSTGKTSLACAIAHEWWQSGTRPVVAVRIGDLLTTTLDPAVGPTFSRLATADADTLVILDDLPNTAARWSSFTNLVSRLDALGCRIITTTNLGLGDRLDVEQVDPRVRSRLEPDGCLLVPLHEALGGTPPEPPGTGPCPYHCEQPGTFALGHLANCDVPEIAALTEDVIVHEMQWPGAAPYYGLRRPDPQDYVEVDPDEAEQFLRLAWQRWDVAFDWHSHNTGHWCPHCRPEMCKWDGFLERRLAELGRPLVTA